MASFSRSAQSRLKSRKVLGVGECADGNIPRSKISQLLGQNELQPWTLPEDHYPVGLRVFQWATCLYFTLVGLITLWNPHRFYLHSSCVGAHREFDTTSLVRRLTVHVDQSQQEISSREDSHDVAEDLNNLLVMVELPVRLYGVAMLSLGVFFLLCTSVNSGNRRCVRLSLIVQGMYLLLETIVAVLSASWQRPHNVTTWSSMGTSLMFNGVVRFVVILLCAFYYTRTEVPKENGQKRQD